MSKKQNQNIPCIQHSPKKQPASPGIGKSWKTASGKIPYGMTNDYMFRAVLQSSNKVLRGLICSLLHLSEEEVTSISIQNSILLGETIKHKEIRLDVYVLLNNHTLINLEMQVANRLNWKNRSVIYLCRSFDSLDHGQDYLEAKPVIHIGLLDYTLFRDCPEFYASYQLINVKNQRKYSDIITLNVIDLSRIDLATEEDKQYHIDDWMSFMKATTWEEIRMLAAKNEYLEEAAETLSRLSANKEILKQCHDIVEYYQDLKNYERAIEERDNIIAERDSAIAEQEALIQRLRAENERLRMKE
ncbi:MAG: Rpn family recombination-promoting nuclease/putative transposase [Muribaculaceae bacterium]|nr:Rpn family recombination-promoting nuclease/putative transposase [Muribaculaceae bacterium]